MSEQPSSSRAVAILSRTDLFSQLDPAILKKFSSELEMVHLEGGDTLMQEGDPGDCMYTVISGRLHVFVQASEGPERLVGAIGSGESIGEMALITREPRSATVRAARDSELVRISTVGFEQLITRHPEAMMNIARVVVTRMRRLLRGERLSSPLKTFTLVPAGEGVLLAEFAERLARSLEVHGRVLHVNADAGSTQLERGAWLDDQESANRFILYEADRTVSAWTKRCIREADRIVLVGHAASSPDLGAIEKEIDRIRTAENKLIAESELVLLHEDRRIPVGTERWLRKREVIRHHHACLHDPDDMARVARIISGEAIGLVLGGGGARGFAHIGVIRAIEEAGIPIDMICGVSMGAILAAQYAMGCDYESMLRMNKEGIAHNKLGRDVTLPLMSLNSGRKFRRVLKSFYGDTNIEDLWLNYFCVSCNLSTAATVTHRRGSLWRAVNASNAVPGIMPPVLSGGNLLVDGGIVNNQPGDILKKECGGPVIVVNVSPKSELTVDASYEEMPSPWGVLWSRLSPFHKNINVPHISSMMMRTLMVGSQRKSDEVEMMADYYLQPPLDHFRLDDYVKIDDIVEVGYHYAREHIAAWTGLSRP